MRPKKSLPHKAILFIVVITGIALLPNAFAREINIAFIEDGSNESAPHLSTIIIQELKPLLKKDHKIVPTFLGKGDVEPHIFDLFEQASSDPAIDYIVTTGYIGSQALYSLSSFSKPTYLSRLVDPQLIGETTKEALPNLRSYSTKNGTDSIFERIKTLFNAKNATIIYPQNAEKTHNTISKTMMRSAQKSGIDLMFLSIDFSKNIADQLVDTDVVLVTPFNQSREKTHQLFQALIQRKIPSYSLGGESLVESGALISDTLNEDERVLARKIALDLQLSIYDEAKTMGINWLQTKKRTTLNLDTANLIDIDIAVSELISARVIRSSNNSVKLAFLPSLNMAMEQNLDLRIQSQQLSIDKEFLEQAKSKRRPQLALQLQQVQRNERTQLAEQESQASIGFDLSLYSSANNVEFNVAKLGLDASKYTLDQVKLETIQRTAHVYFQALQTQAQTETSLRDLILNQENLILAQQRKSSGSGTGAEIFRWEASIAASETSLVQAYTANNQSLFNLFEVLNTPPTALLTLKDVDLDQPPFDLLHNALLPFLNNTNKINLLRAASTKRAFDNSPQLEGAAKNIAISDTQLQSLKRAYFTPNISMNAQYTDHLESSLENRGETLDDDWSVSLNAELPLWLGGSRTSLKRQYASQRNQAKTQLQNIQLSLQTQINKAITNLVANYRVIELSQRSEEAARKSQLVTQDAYRLGSASVTELLDTQNSYRQTQDNANIARYQYLSALVDFQTLLGEMPMLLPLSEQLQWINDFTQTILNETTQ